MTTKKFAALLLGACCLVPCVAEIRWVEKDFDFGLMREVDGPKTGTSRFINVGRDTISIFSVKPSCGCTSADFSDEPLAPGDTAVIHYTYDPNMRPGKFEKSVKVTLANGDKHTIKIRGNVLGTPESLDQLYPVDAGDMRLSASKIDAGEIVMGRAPVAFLNAYSLPLDTIYPKVNIGSPSLKCVPMQPKAGPGDVVTFGFTFDSYAQGAYGPVEIPIEITPNPANPNSEAMVVPFNVFVIPDSDRLALMQGDKNPLCRLESDLVSVGDLSQSQHPKKLSVEVRVYNSGRGPLKILYVGSQSPALRVQKFPKEVRAGKSGILKFQIDTSELPRCTFRIPVDIVTDDPDNLHPTLTLTGSL